MEILEKPLSKFMARKLAATCDVPIPRELIRATREATERRLATERAAQATRERERERAQNMTVDLEARYGPILDAISPKDSDDLAKGVFGELLCARSRQGQLTGVCREQLLHAIADNRSWEPRL